MSDTVYRLDVQYPDLPPWPNDAPARWWEAYGDDQPPVELERETGAYVDIEWPGWPANRRFLSRKAADRRAERLRAWGATVTVVEGRITWDDDPR